MKFVRAASISLIVASIAACGGSDSTGRLNGDRTSQIIEDDSSQGGDSFNGGGRQPSSTLCRVNDSFVVTSVQPMGNNIDRNRTTFELEFSKPVDQSSLDTAISVTDDLDRNLGLSDFVLSANGLTVSFNTVDRLGPNRQFDINVNDAVKTSCIEEGSSAFDAFNSSFATEQDSAPLIKVVGSTAGTADNLDRGDRILVRVDDDEDVVSYAQDAIKFKYPLQNEFESVVSDAFNAVGEISLEIKDRPDIDGELVVKIDRDLITDSEGQAADATNVDRELITSFTINKPSTLVSVNSGLAKDLGTVNNNPTFAFQLDRELINLTGEFFLANVK